MDEQRGGLNMPRALKERQNAGVEALEGENLVRKQILMWLLQHPYQRQEDVALAIKKHPSSAYRHLAYLTEQGLVESVKPTLGVTNTRYFYYLTTPGICAVAHLLGMEPVSI